MTINRGRRAFLSALPVAALAFSLQRADATTTTVPSSTDDDKSLLAKLSSLKGIDDDGVLALENELYQWHTDIGQALINQGASPLSTVETKASAIYFLGKLQIVSAIPLLVENIDFQDPNHMMNKRIWMWEGYPAVGALTNIGRAAIGPVVDGVSTMC
jgi:hypothetical protein